MSARACAAGFLGVLQTDIRQNTPPRHSAPALAGQSAKPQAWALRPLAFSSSNPGP